MKTNEGVVLDCMGIRTMLESEPDILVGGRRGSIVGVDLFAMADAAWY
jgi:hypothetical protein